MTDSIEDDVKDLEALIEEVWSGLGPDQADFERLARMVIKMRHLIHEKVGK